MLLLLFPVVDGETEAVRTQAEAWCGARGGVVDVHGPVWLAMGTSRGQERPRWQAVGAGDTGADKATLS